MTETLVEVVVGALIGIVAGIASGLAGIGGGLIMVPAMVFVLDFPQHLAQGTSLLAMVFTSVAGTAVNRHNRNVDVRLALTIGIIGAAAAFLAARLANMIDADVLRRLFGSLVLLAGLRMLAPTLRPRRSRSQ